MQFKCIRVEERLTGTIDVTLINTNEKVEGVPTSNIMIHRPKSELNLWVVGETYSLLIGT